jgi:divalent metal cation (Fe/Co/Zn/Cd) transporter
MTRLSPEKTIEHTNQSRAAVLERALGLEYVTIGWNVVEGVVAVTAALGAGSVALLGFGIDSFIESASGGILTWRLLAEKRGRGRSEKEVAQLDERAKRLVAYTLFLLAAYIAFDAASKLWHGERPEPSALGIAVTAVSLGVMWWLARAKRGAAHALESRALEADSVQTTACWSLSLIVLGGIGLNALLGWWWADPVAALGMTWFLVQEGREAWHGEDCWERRAARTIPEGHAAASGGDPATSRTGTRRPSRISKRHFQTAYSTG